MLLGFLPYILHCCYFFTYSVGVLGKSNNAHVVPKLEELITNLREVL